MESTPSKRLALIKTMIYLMLKAPEELSTIDSAIFGQFFKLATVIDDEEATENILWIQSALIEINFTDDQH